MSFFKEKFKPAVFFRKIRLWLGKLILDKTNPPLDFSLDKIKKIIFVRYEGKIGDHIVSSFIFREIKKQAPHIQIHIIVQEKIADLCRQNPFIDEVIVVKNKKILTLFCVARQLSKKQYDLLVHFGLNLHNRDLLFIRGVKAKVNAGYHKENYQLFSLNLPYLPQSHHRIVSAKMLERIGFSAIDDRYAIPRDAQAEEKTNLFLQKYSQPLIAINFWGAEPKRKMNLSSSLELLKILLDIFPSHLLLVLSAPDMRDFVLEVLEKIASSRVISPLETSRIQENIALIARSELLISPDTSLVHIAEGLQKPILAFYSDDEENFAQWHPSGENVKVIRYPKNIRFLPMEQIKSALFEIKKKHFF